MKGPPDQEIVSWANNATDVQKKRRMKNTETYIFIVTPVAINGECYNRKIAPSAIPVRIAANRIFYAAVIDVILKRQRVRSLHDLKIFIVQ